MRDSGEVGGALPDPVERVMSTLDGGWGLGGLVWALLGPSAGSPRVSVGLSSWRERVTSLVAARDAVVVWTLLLLPRGLLMCKPQWI